MKKVMLDYGDAKMEAELPDSAMVVRYNETYRDPPTVPSVADAAREALARPLGMPRLRELAGPNKKIVIGFPDRVKGGVQPESHRRVSIPIIVEELLAGGAKIENITLLCAVGLHRKNTVEEWYWYLGKPIVDRFWPDRIVNHDAETDVLDFGADAMGNVVQCNRLLAEADLPIILGHAAGNPYGGFSGGYKMLVTGHTGWRSIGSHHRPSTMHRDDWLGGSTDSMMRRQFKSIGKKIEEKIGKKIFAVDAVLGQKSQVLQIAAGAIEEVEAATWPLANRRTNIELDLREKADVLVMGLPRNFHYGPGMGTNPILMGLAIGGQLSRCWGAFREGGVIIAASVCDGWFNDSWFPSYEETYQELQKHALAADFLASPAAERIATDVDYRFRYSNNFTYHPFHAMSMISGASIVSERTSAAFVVGARAPQYARGMGYIPTNTFADAMKRAERYVGRNPRVLATPEAFSGGVGVHLRTR